jgi:hypothetical protein
MWSFKVTCIKEFKKFALCFNLTKASIFEFSTITFHYIDANGIGIVDFVLAPNNCLSLYPEPKFYGPTILPYSNIRLTLNIIGNLTHANHRIKTNKNGFGLTVTPNRTNIDRLVNISKKLMEEWTYI